MSVFIDKMLKKANILNLSENERSFVIGWLQSCDHTPIHGWVSLQIINLQTELNYLNYVNMH